MSKGQFGFIVVLCLIAVLVLILGECIIGLWLNLGMTASRIWLIFVVVATCTISVWHGIKQEKE